MKEGCWRATVPAGRRSAAKLLSKDEARRIAANIAKVPKFCAKANSTLIAVIVTAAAHTRPSLADRISSTKAERKYDQKGNNQIHFR